MPRDRSKPGIFQLNSFDLEPFIGLGDART